MLNTDGPVRMSPLMGVKGDFSLSMADDISIENCGYMRRPWMSSVAHGRRNIFHNLARRQQGSARPRMNGWVENHIDGCGEVGTVSSGLSFPGIIYQYRNKSVPA